MKLNKEKHIGKVLFIVEGSQMEFSVLQRVFCSLLRYNYIEKRRNKPDKFISKQDRFSQVAVVNTKDSNIRDISENEEYLDEVFKATPHKDHILYFVRVLLAYFPSYCTIRPSKATALRRPRYAICRKI